MSKSLLLLTLLLDFPAPVVKLVEIPPVPYTAPKSFDVILESLPQVSRLWLKLRFVRSIANKTTYQETDWSLIDQTTKRTTFNNTGAYNSRLVDLSQTSVFSGMFGVQTRNLSSWGPEFTLKCCQDYIRPENQTTLILSGVVSRYVDTMTDKIQIASGTIIKVPIKTPWEIILPDVIVYEVDYFGHLTFPKLISGKPIFFSETTLRLSWLPPDPKHERKISMIALATSIVETDYFKAIEHAPQGDVCNAVTGKIGWTAERNFDGGFDLAQLYLDLDITCNRECIYADRANERTFVVAMALASSISVIAILIFFLFAVKYEFTHFHKVNFCCSVLFVVFTIAGALTMIIQGHQNMAIQNDGWCDYSYEPHEFFVVVTPMSFFSIATLVFIVWGALVLHPCCKPETVQPLVICGKTSPKSRAIQFVGYLILCNTFIWLTFVLPLIMETLQYERGWAGGLLVLFEASLSAATFGLFTITMSIFACGSCKACYACLPEIEEALEPNETELSNDLSRIQENFPSPTSGVVSV